MVQFTTEITGRFHGPPKIAMDQESLKFEIRYEARMIQRAYDYFQSNINAGNIGLPNSRSIKAYHLSNARSLEPVYKFKDCPDDDDGEFPESWVKVPGAMKTVLDDFAWYAPRLVENPDEDLVSMVECVLGKDAVNREIKSWLRSLPRYIRDVPRVAGPQIPVYVPLEFERVEYKPFANYQKFEKAVPYEPTKEELAETERLRKQSEACGTPSEQTARCYLFDLIETSPSAREALEKQAREDPKAAYHIKLLMEKKDAADKAKELESNSEGKEIPTKVDDQKEMVRQMYLVGISEDNDSDSDNDKVFQIEQGPLEVSQSRRFPKPVLTGCPTGILIDF
ncbi:hypothetical protein FPOA_09138 [Fusarium poae]|uniref:Uncharacterized protein n=1 Tax=Fusarium poae TaxID=36050 RepID=A0A1B8AQI8_FUSPO|nr:hypothetical protein FPOA_09138 [Fusarium poae]